MRLLVIAPEPVSAHLAGPSVRSLEIARQLARDFETTLAVPQRLDLPAAEPCQICTWTRQSVIELLATYDVVISQGTQYPARGCVPTRGRQPIQVFDLHNPLLFGLVSDSS